MPAPESPEAIRDVNTRYHDAAAAEYDVKWGIDFHEIGAGQVLGKLRKALATRELPHFPAALEVGAGTGYFALNLLRAGVVGHATCLDISPGMLDALRVNAQRLGLQGLVETVAADGEHLPFDDDSFDLVFGHAVLHHLPDLDQAFREFERVLKPGGTLVFAGEPSRQGDRLAAYPKRYALKAAPLWRKLMRAQPASGHDMVHAAPPVQEHDDADGHELEPFVDVHAFDPVSLRAFAERSGLRGVEVRGEELLANWFGWANRTLEATAEPDTVPWAWRQYAFRGYILLQHVDRLLLEPRLPAGVFYNLILTARKAG
jgi:ubiquinone/menaquinone biosynthesis C-methylase UbiE